MTLMSVHTFGDLIQLLRERSYPTWYLYDPRSDPWWVSLQQQGAGLREPWCAGAWILVVGGQGCYAYRGWGADRQEVRFATEGEACKWLEWQITTTFDPGTTMLEREDLPAAVREFIDELNPDPRPARLGDRLVARKSSMAYRITRDSRGYTLWHPSIAPPTVGDEVFQSRELDDVLRVLVMRLGDSIPQRVGHAKWGIFPAHKPSLDYRPALDQWAGLSLEQIVAAYRGSPAGILTQLFAPAALHLVDDEIRERAAARGWKLLAGGGPDRVMFDSSETLALQHTGNGYVVLLRRERQNNFETVAAADTLQEARSILFSLL